MCVRVCALVQYPAGKHNATAMRQIWEFGTGTYMGEIPEAPATYNVIGEHPRAMSTVDMNGA